MTERKLLTAVETQIEQTFTSKNTRELFRDELKLPMNIGENPIERTKIIVDIVLHSGTPLEGIKCQRRYKHDEEFSSDIVVISKRRKEGGIIGFALVVQGFNLKDETEKYYRYERHQHTKPWIGAIPLWESRSGLPSESREEKY